MIKLLILAVVIGFVTVTAMGQTTQPAKSKVVFDRFGQKAAVNWPTKVRSEAELQADVKADEDYYEGLKPPTRDLYGGLPGSREKYRLKKTGFFHIEKAGERQILVTPEGNLYFMLATGGVFPYHDFMTVQGREADYEWLPPVNGPFRKAWVDPKRGVFSFVIANDIRKHGSYGPDRWKQAFVARLRKWGFNGMNSYGRMPNLAAQTHYPTIQVLQEFNGCPDEVTETIENFIDPFDPETLRKVEAAAKEALLPYVNEPVLIGYYVGNEKHFAYIPSAIPKLTGEHAAKRRLVQTLRDKYKTIDRFNAAWKMRARSFDDLLGPILPETTQAGKDMLEYKRLFLDAYFKFITQTIRKYDPNHLILGNRVRVRDAKDALLNEISGRYMDALSVNYYTFMFNKYIVRDMHVQSGGRPIILSEWSYDAEDQGLTDHLRQVENQTARGLAYRNYIEQAATLPYVIGVQWWCTLDYLRDRQWNTGLVNVTDRPYKEFLAEVMKTNYAIYDLVLGKQKPFEYHHPNFQPRKQSKKLIEIPHALAGMKIDGLQPPWPNRPGETIGPENFVHGLNPGQIQGDFWLCWDDQYLYLYLDVQDPTPRQNDHDGRGIWGGDAVELFLGSESPGRTGPLLLTDRQLLISLGRRNPPEWFWACAASQPKVNMVILDRTDQKGCILEAAVPFEALGIQPKPGRELLFDIGLDDSADAKLGRLRQFMWNGTDANSIDRTNWGKARLSE